MQDKIINFKVMGDERGSLIALEENHNVPFDVKQGFYIYGTQKSEFWLINKIKKTIRKKSNGNALSIYKEPAVSFAN